MALVRCNLCGIRPPGRGGYKRTYVRNVKPLGHPQSALVCGTPSCTGAGLIWLEKSESAAYNNGERIFSLQTNTTKVQAQ